jgi:hypothetical protein
MTFARHRACVPRFPPRALSAALHEPVGLRPRAFSSSQLEVPPQTGLVCGATTLTPPDLSLAATADRGKGEGGKPCPMGDLRRSSQLIRVPWVTFVASEVCSTRGTQNCVCAMPCTGKIATTDADECKVRPVATQRPRLPKKHMCMCSLLISRPYDCVGW